MPYSVTNALISLKTDRAHLVRGLLLEPDLVMVPDPPEALLVPGAEFDVAIAPDGGGGRSVRYPQPREFTVIRDALEEGTVVVAFVRLAERSPHSVWRGPLGRGRLEAALKETASLWAALERVGAIPPAFCREPVVDAYFAEPEYLSAASSGPRRPVIRHEISLKNERCGIICRLCMITHACE